MSISGSVSGTSGHPSGTPGSLFSAVTQWPDSSLLSLAAPLGINKMGQGTCCDPRSKWCTQLVSLWLNFLLQPPSLPRNRANRATAIAGSLLTTDWSEQSQTTACSCAPALPRFLGRVKPCCYQNNIFYSFSTAPVQCCAALVEDPRGALGLDTRDAVSHAVLKSRWDLACAVVWLL